MPKRSKPRDPDQTLKIVRFLRDRYISPEARELARRKWDELQAEKAGMRAPAGAEAWLLAAHDPRGDDAFLDQEKDGFSEWEMKRARNILDAIRGQHPTEAVADPTAAAEAAAAEAPSAGSDEQMARGLLAAIKSRYPRKP